MSINVIRSISTICCKQVIAYRYILCTCLLLFLLFIFVVKDKDVSSRSVSSRSVDVRYQEQRHGIRVHPRKKNELECGKDSTQQVILLTYGRSGSSLTADIIQQQEEVFFYYEPLHNLAKTYENTQAQYKKKTHRYLHLTEIREYNLRALNIIEKLMTCNYKGLPKVASRNNHMRLYNSTMDMFWCMLSAPTTGTQRKCLKEGEKKCREKSIHFLKIIRLTTKAVGLLMRKYPCLKMIYLVRDPRGSYLSKKKAFGFMSANTTYEADRYCSRMNKDIDNAVNLRQQYPGRVHITRYEHIAEKPLETSQKLYQFLNLEFTNRIAEYVHSNTQSGKGDESVYSLARANSSEAAYAWRKTISFDDVSAFDEQCSDVYYKLGYLPANTKADLRNLRKPLKFDTDIYS